MILIISEKESERRFKAQQHDDMMQDKYGRLNGMSAAFDDYHYWYEERTDKPGYFRHEYPLPYSQQHYFRRFVELFFATGAERSLLPTLAHEFLGDEVDADYINGLFISAEQYGFFNPGAIIIFNGATISWLPPPATKGGRYTLAQSKDIHQQVYEGSKANKERAKVIRKWLKRRATELAALPSAIPDTIKATSAPGIEPSKKLTDLSLNPADLIMAPGFTLDAADALARAVQLIDDRGRYHLGNRKFGAVVGFALALQQAGKLTGAIPALTAVLGPRWGVNIATRKTSTGVADRYFKLTNKALARLEKTD